MRYRLTPVLLSIISVVTLFVFATPEQAYAHHGSIKICNESGSKYEISFMFRNRLRFWDNSWSSKGWYTVPVGGCVTLIDGFGAAFEGYVAFSQKGLLGKRKPKNVMWRTNYRFGEKSTDRYCVSMKEYRRSDIPLSSHKSCPSGYELFPFSAHLWHNSEEGKEFRVLTIES